MLANDMTKQKKVNHIVTAEWDMLKQPCNHKSFFNCQILILLKRDQETSLKDRFPELSFTWEKYKVFSSEYCSLQNTGNDKNKNN